MEKIMICFDDAKELKKNAKALRAQAYKVLQMAEEAERAEHEKIIQYTLDSTNLKKPLSASALLSGIEGISSQKLVGRLCHDSRVKHQRTRTRRKFIEVGEDGKPVEGGAVMYATQTHNVYWGK
jgi:hypothetical protein